MRSDKEESEGYRRFILFPASPSPPGSSFPPSHTSRSAFLHFLFSLHLHHSLPQLPLFPYLLFTSWSCIVTPAEKSYSHVINNHFVINNQLQPCHKQRAQGTCKAGSDQILVLYSVNQLQSSRVQSRLCLVRLWLLSRSCRKVT